MARTDEISVVRSTFRDYFIIDSYLRQRGGRGPVTFVYTVRVEEVCYKARGKASLTPPRKGVPQLVEQVAASRFEYVVYSFARAVGRYVESFSCITITQACGKAAW